MKSKVCYFCGKKIPRRLNYIKEPTHYFKLVQKDEEDCIYFCNWDCIKKHLAKNKKVKIIIS